MAALPTFDTMLTWIASALRCQKLVAQKYPAVLIHRPRHFLVLDPFMEN